MNDDDGGLMGKNAVQSLKDWFGMRTPLRRTYGSPGLTRAVDLCDSLEKMFLDEAAQAKILEDTVWERIAMRYAEQFEQRKFNLTDGAAGESGWDTERAIEAAEAVTPKPTYRMEGGGKGD